MGGTGSMKSESLPLSPYGLITLAYAHFILPTSPSLPPGMSCPSLCSLTLTTFRPVLALTPRGPHVPSLRYASFTHCPLLYTRSYSSLTTFAHYTRSVLSLPTAHSLRSLTLSHPPSPPLRLAILAHSHWLVLPLQPSMSCLVSANSSCWRVRMSQ